MGRLKKPKRAPAGVDKFVPLTVMLTPSIKDAVVEHARLEGSTASAFVRDAISKKIDRRFGNRLTVKQEEDLCSLVRMLCGLSEEFSYEDRLCEAALDIAKELKSALLWHQGRPKDIADLRRLLYVMEDDYYGGGEIISQDDMADVEDRIKEYLDNGPRIPKGGRERTRKLINRYMEKLELCEDDWL